MTPFAIAGVQMHVNALQSNVDGMIHRLDLLMARFPWTQMVLFSELAPWTYRDHRYLHYTMEKLVLPDDEELIRRADEMHKRNLEPVQR